MRISLKVKLTALISLLVLLVVLATSAVYMANFIREALDQVQQKAVYILDETYTRARVVVAKTRIPSNLDPANHDVVRQFIYSSLTQDGGLRSLMESAAAYSTVIDYVAITNEEQVVLAHNDPSEIGQRLTPGPPLNGLMRGGFYRQLRVLYGPPAVYEVVLPLEMGNQPFGTVRVGISTVFLRAQVNPHLRGALELSLLVILLATASAALLSFRVLKPIASISGELDRLARGEFSKPVEVRRADEWGILSSKLNLLGEQIRGEKAAYIALKDNLDQLFGKLAEGWMLFDPQNRLVLATPAVARFLGRKPADLARQSAAEIFAGEGALNVLLRRSFEQRKPVPSQTVDLAADAETPRVAVSVEFVEEQGQPVVSLVTLRDADTRAQLKDQIDVTAKLAALGRLTSGVAHEVKNPLNAMILQVEILKTKLQSRDQDVKPQLDVLTSEIRRLDRVVKTFLDFTRPLELRRVETDLAELMKEVFTLAEPHARKSNVRLILDPNGAIPLLKLDCDLMKQALLNLVLNGCQAMPSGGELRVKPHQRPHWVELEIADQGVGIPPEAHPKIFSLYYTTKPGGSGVGLAMTYRIIQLHQGDITFSSEPNQGTTFRITLPSG
ncbi:MAG TPA: ATP-binding protein [Terriglobia bacterium]|nr:ATP-binding protein [Terriglobia bacterium]